MKLFRKGSPPLERHRTPRDPQPSTPRLSYYSHRIDEQLPLGRQLQRESRKPALQRRLHRFWLSRFGLVILLLTAIVCTVDVLSVSTTAKIVPVGSTANSPFLQDQTMYQTAADKLLAASVWNRTKLSIDTGQLSRRLLAEFPELTHVSIVLPLLAHRPLIYIQSAQPALIFRSTTGAFVLGTTGQALLGSSFATLSRQFSKLPVITDQSGLKLALDQQALTASDVNFIQMVDAQLTARQVAISGMTLPPATRELDVQLSNQPYFVKFNLENADPRQQVGTFLAAQANLAGQHITPSSYIDVRVDGRAYYK